MARQGFLLGIGVLQLGGNLAARLVVIAPPFGHSHADKCCTRIPDTFPSLAAAAAATAPAVAS